MRKSFIPVSGILLLAASWAAFGAGSGSSSGGSSATRYEAPATPEETARLAYNAGVHAIEKADELSADAARQSDPKKQQKILRKARSAYSGALKKFLRATDLNPVMYEAWNYQGYAHRMLGDYQASLSAYDRALNLKPGFPEAIEYRGHTYLRLNRLDDAKQAYLTLFSGNRQLAAKLLAGMQAWVGERRGDPAGVDGAALESFAAWVSERGVIASQTAGLTREGASARW